MLEQLIEILKNSDIDDYKITDKKTVSHEFFFVKHNLDQNRKKEVEHVNVIVYKKLEDGKFLGSATGEVYLNSSAEEMKATIDRLALGASLAKNAYYELNSADHAEKCITELPDPLAVVKDIIETVQSCHETATEYINSYEIFVNVNETRILTSRGIDVTFNNIDSMIEVVLNASNGQHEVEIYRLLRQGVVDKAALKAEIESSMKLGSDKLVAGNTPNLKKGTVLVSGRNVCGLLAYYAQKCDVENIYQGMSNYEIGKPVSDQEFTGDKITVTAVVNLEGSSSNFAFDEEGTKLADRVLIEDNIVKNYWGNVANSQYVGKSTPAIYKNVKIKGGSTPVAELKNQPYLEVLEMSSGLHCDPMTGNFAGEIRLAYYYDGKTVRPVSGGSIVGNINELAPTMKLSKETAVYDAFRNTMEVPTTVCLYNVGITGIDE